MAKEVDIDGRFDYEGMKMVMNEAAMKPLIRAGADVEKFAKQSMKKGGQMKGAGKRGVPSTPPAPPHRQTGTLSNSVTHAATTGLDVVIGPTVKYGKVHEKGLRPFMAPALEKVKSQFAKYFQNMPLSRTSAGQNLNRKYNK